MKVRLPSRDTLLTPRKAACAAGGRRVVEAAVSPARAAVVGVSPERVDRLACCIAARPLAGVPAAAAVELVAGHVDAALEAARHARVGRPARAATVVAAAGEAL